MLLSFGVLAWLGLPTAAPAAQPPDRVFVAPLAANQESGPTRHEYVMLADFTVWFEHEGIGHSMLLWDAHGDLVGERGGVLQGHNIVKDVCDAIREDLAE